jgi:hypothetical protein
MRHYTAQVRHPVAHFNVFGDRDGKGFRSIHGFKAERHAVEEIAPTLPYALSLGGDPVQRIDLGSQRNL